MTTRTLRNIDGVDPSRPFKPGQTILEAARRRRHLHPASLLPARPQAARQLQALHGDRQRPHGLGLHDEGAGRPGGRDRHAGVRRRCAARWCRCCSSRATTSARRCEKSGDCELQALGYELEHDRRRSFPAISSPIASVDASHPDVLLDRNRCILCELCVRASRDVDGKNVFALRRARHANAKLVVNSPSGPARPTATSRSTDGAAGLSGRRDPGQARRLRAPRSASAASTAPRSATRHSKRASVPEAASARERRLKSALATTSLAGCFGCHMSLLDIDERMFELVELVEFDRSPLDDIKAFDRPVRHRADRGRRAATRENVHVLREFREHCKILVAVGACAINGGLPAHAQPSRSRRVPRTRSIDDPVDRRRDIPDDPELPLPARQGLSRARGRARSTTSCPAARRRPTRSGNA